MSKVEFPWSTTSSQFEEAPLAPPPETWAHRTWRYIRHFFPVLLCLAMLINLVFEKKEPIATSAPVGSMKRIPVLVSLLPQTKGTPLQLGILRELPLLQSELTKSDRLSLLQVEDLEKIKEGIIVKRQLPPRKPITWKDLELRPPTQTSKIRVLYRGENPQ